MNRFVRCPGCEAIYKVVPDQLKIGKGWLRCGQCRLAFDSTGLVLAWPENTFPTTDVPSNGVVVERLVIDELLKQEDQSTKAEPVSDTLQLTTTVGSFEAALTTFKPLPMPLPSVQATNLEVSDAIAPFADTNLAQKEPAIRNSRWGAQKKLISVAFLLGLLFQWLWIERQTLASSEPLAAKAMQVACQKLGCNVLPLQVINGIVIESSSLLKQENGFQLNWSLRNSALQMLELPALELTLLNAEDKALVRRTLFVAEIGGPALLAPGEGWKGQLNISPQGELTPTGYRLLNFYP